MERPPRLPLTPVRSGDLRATPGWFHREPGVRGWAGALGVGVPAERLLESPVGAFVVEHPEAGPVLVDTGLHPAALTDLAADFGRLNARVFASLRPRPGGLVTERLAALGRDAADVRLVVMTHLHVDHTGGMRLLPRAEFVCDRREWAAATRRGAGLDGYRGAHLPGPGRMRLLDLAGADGTPWGAFARTHDLLGDGSLRLLSTPGHTRGHLSVLVAAPGRDVLLAGDAAYTRRNLREDLLPRRTADDDAYLRSLAELRAHADAHPETLLVPTHDAAQWAALEDA